MSELLTNIADGIRRLTMSYDEYVEWADEDVHAEWVDGEVIVHTPPKEEHQGIVGFLYELLSQYVRLEQSGTVYFAPFEVTLWDDGPARAPDIFYVPDHDAGQHNGNHVNVTLGLVVEVISPGTVIIDRNDKLREYEEAGVREYWIIDSRPGYQRADFYHLGDDGRYALFATEDDEIVQSKALPGLWLHPAWLWHEQLPNPLLLLADIVGAETLVEIVRGERAAHVSNGDRQIEQTKPRRLTGTVEPATDETEADMQLAPISDEEPTPETH